MDDWHRVSRRHFLQVGTSGVALAALVIALPVEALVPPEEPRPELLPGPHYFLGIRSEEAVAPGGSVGLVAVPNQTLLIDELRVAPETAAAFSIDRMPERALWFAGEPIQLHVTNRSCEPKRFRAMWICSLPMQTIL